MDTLHTLTQRVSAGALVSPAPSDEALAQILAAASRAPDHGQLRPWRFFVIRDGAREALGQLMVDRLLAKNPGADAAQIDRERKKPLRAPMILVVAAKVDPQNKIPVIEQVLSAGAAAQNVMLAAFALGYGCAWKTGDAAYDPAVKAAFGLAPEDAIVGYMYLGTNAKPLAPPPAADPRNDAVEWKGPLTGKG